MRPARLAAEPPNRSTWKHYTPIAIARMGAVIRATKDRWPRGVQVRQLLVAFGPKRPPTTAPSIARVQSPVLYRAIRFIRGISAMCVLGAYIAAGAAAFFLMFIFPPGSLLILFVALLSLGAVAIAMKTLGWLEHRLALRAISRGTCPQCESRDTMVHDDDHGCACAACGSAFAPNGERANEAPHPAS